MVLTVEVLEDLILSVLVWWAIGYGLGTLHRVIKQVVESMK